MGYKECKYFNDINTLEQLRSEYKKLLKQYHLNNVTYSTAATQGINSEYDI